VPEFLSRPLEWLRGRSNVQKALIGAGVLVALIAASRVVLVIALLVFIVAAVAFLVQLARRRPTRAWMIIALGSLAATVLFGAVEGAISGP
jgi:lipopolysaccharide export LptBFGC system permease protein LptF